MKLFLPNGSKLDPSSSTYYDHVLEVGQQSEDNMFRFFVAHGAMRKSGSSVPKQLRKYYYEGKLDALITEFRARVAIETILDPAPRETQELFSSMLSIEDIVTYRDFKTLCITFAKAAKLRIMDASIRALRNSMIQTIGTRDCKNKGKAKSKKKNRGLVELDDIQEWLISPTNGAVGQVRGTYGVRRLLQRVVMGNKPHYLVDWEPTLEPRENIAKELVTQFNRDRHELVRSTFIDDEAVEDNTGKALLALVDKIGMHLAIKKGRKGQLLSRHLAMLYNRQTKNWLLDQFPYVAQRWRRIY
ncbi:hypothetical protein PHMEG_0003055 [Phytophthora megakarya]|uniref:Uncharacterized protein n=1 Tax=Phytophthora megakarya TaxID=4795 RepID=A0A225WX60_9STRA|nr:hypothetical protein PHMEG_0003055 [Phytophthora megakarya]